MVLLKKSLSVNGQSEGGNVKTIRKINHMTGARIRSKNPIMKISYWEQTDFPL